MLFKDKKMKTITKTHLTHHSLEQTRRRLTLPQDNKISWVIQPRWNSQKEKKMKMCELVRHKLSGGDTKFGGDISKH